MTILNFNPGYGKTSLIRCDNCGEEFERFTSKIENRKTDKHFCNRECKAKFQTKHSKHEYTPGQKAYNKFKAKESKNARLNQDVQKRCMCCARLYMGPTGGFRRTPEPGLCPSCKYLNYYTESDYGAGIVRL